MKLIIKDISTDPAAVDFRVFTETGEEIENVTSIEMGRDLLAPTECRMTWRVHLPKRIKRGAERAAALVGEEEILRALENT